MDPELEYGNKLFFKALECYAKSFAAAIEAENEALAALMTEKLILLLREFQRGYAHEKFLIASGLKTKEPIKVFFEEGKVLPGWDC